jgi:hypothetical protein
MEKNISTAIRNLKNFIKNKNPSLLSNEDENLIIFLLDFYTIRNNVLNKEIINITSKTVENNITYLNNLFAKKK